MTGKDQSSQHRDRRFAPLALNAKGDRKLANSLLSFVWLMSGRHQIGLCLFAIVVSLLITAPIELHRRIIEQGIEAGNLGALKSLAIIYVILILSGQVAKFLLRLYQSWIAESAIFNSRRRIADGHALRTVGQDDDDAGATVSVMGQEVDKLGGFVGDGLSGAAANLAILFGVVGYMMIVEPSIAIYALAFLVPQIALTPVIQRKLNKLIETRVQLMRDMGDEVVSPDGADEILPEQIRDIYGNRLHFLALKFAMKSLLNLLNAAGPMVVLLYGGYLVIEGETTLGVIVAFLTGFEKLSSPVRELISFYRMYAQANVQHEMIAKWMRPAQDASRTQPVET